jgi:cytochrome c oxidase accessory protein FixG
MMTNRFHRLRRISGSLLLALLVALPFLHINSRSVLRFDVPSLRLLFFGTEIWINDFFIVLIATIFLTFFILFATTLLGRIWCGWLCPQTVAVDLTHFIETAKKRGGLLSAAAAGIALIASSLLSICMVGYFAPIAEIPRAFLLNSLQDRVIFISWSALTAVFFLNILMVRRKFCATVCPYAKMQNVLFDDRTLLVAFDRTRAEECQNCAACVKACPVNVDIRTGTQMACIHCAECVDACTERMAHRNRASLVRYAFGTGGIKSGTMRVNPLITGLLTALSFAFLIYLSFTRVPFDASIRLDYAAQVAQTAANGFARSYELTVRNMSGDALRLGLSVSTPTAQASISPDVIALAQGADITHVPIRITIHDAKNSPGIVLLTIADQHTGKTVSKTIRFPVPKS